MPLWKRSTVLPGSPRVALAGAAAGAISARIYRAWDDYGEWHLALPAVAAGPWSARRSVSAKLLAGCVALMLGTTSCKEPWAPPEGHCEAGDLDTTVTLRFEEIAAWTGRVVEWRLLGGCGRAGDFTVRDDDREEWILDTGDDVDVSLEAWIDLDGDGAYDAPPTDASWRVVFRLGSDVTIVLPAASTAQVDLGGW